VEVVVKLVRYHEHGNMIMYLRATRNIVLDYMEQAEMMARPFLDNGWHMLGATIESK